MAGKQKFAALPARACGDPRLTAGHWRVLATVAYHDRFNHNGRGCYITHQNMAETIGSSRSSVTQWLRDLLSWGYLCTLEPLTGDRRREAYAVLYDDRENVPVSGH